MEKILEEQVEIISRYVTKLDLYSYKIAKRFKRLFIKTCAQLFLIKNALGKVEEANHYKKMVVSKYPLLWHYRLLRLKHKKGFQRRLNHLKGRGETTRRVQVEKERLPQ